MKRALGFRSLILSVQLCFILRYLAHWMRDGFPPYELSEADPAQFGAWADRVYAVAKAKETYTLSTFTRPLKHDIPSAGRPTSRVNHDMMERLKKEGAQFGFKAGWEVREKKTGTSLAGTCFLSNCLTVLKLAGCGSVYYLTRANCRRAETCKGIEIKIESMPICLRIHPAEKF